MSTMNIFTVLILFTDTIGIESVTITDSSNGRVCIECIFTLFSTVTGCTVELLSSSNNNYTNTFTRSSNTATGCISNVTTGLYTIRVYDQGSTIIVYSMTGLNVTEQPVTSTSTNTITATTIMVNATPSTPSTTVELSQGKDSSAGIFIIIVT